MSTATAPDPWPILAIESDSPDLADQFLAEVSSRIHPTHLAQVPDELRGTYLNLQVPQDVARAAVNAKIQIITFRYIDPQETDRETLKKQRRGTGYTTPDPGDAIHEWRLQEAARLHAAEQRKREFGYYFTGCPACGERVWAACIAYLRLDDGTKFTACPACRQAVHDEQQRQQDTAQQDKAAVLDARRHAVAAALDTQEAAS